MTNFKFENEFPQNEKNTAVIDLTIDSKDFTEKNVLQQKEFNRLKELVKKQIPISIDKITDENDFEGFYKTILVEGGRGTGKTTFLKSFFNKNIQQEFDDIEILPFLDPTRIEDKTSLFLTVVALMKQIVCRKFTKETNEVGIEYKKKCWNDKLNQLAKGLPSINESPKIPNYWDDDFMIMEKGLYDTSSSFNLRENFKKLVKESLEILNKKAFLLIVDDVDTDCDKAWSLLETLRKYLCIQGFITIVSGNIELFSLEVKQEQTKRFNEASKINKENATKQITELTDQYIRKVFPPEYRISLTNLNYVSQSDSSKNLYNYNKPEILIKYDENCNDVLLKNFVTEILGVFGIKNRYQISVYLDFVLNLPLRSQIDFYKVFRKVLISNNKAKLSRTNMFPLEIKEITNLFTEDLINYNIDDELLDDRPYIINCIILKFLTEKVENSNWLSDYYQLQPVTLDKSLNSILFTLGMVLTTRIYKNPEIIFNYMIKVGLVRNVVQIVRNEPTGKYKFSVQDMIRYSSMTDDIDLRHSMCVMTAYLRSITNKIPGILKITKTEKNKLFSLKNEISISLYLAQLPYSCSRDLVNDKDYYEYSIHTLIASIYDIVLAVESGEDFENILRKNTQPREYLMVASSNNEDISEDKSEDEVLEKQNSADVEELYSKLKQWLEFSKKLGKYIPPYVLAKVCTRMYYAYSNVNLKDGRSSRLFYEIMEEFILLLFNSVIIEEIAEYNPTYIPPFENVAKISRENSLNAFQANLNELVSKINVEDVPLCEIILTCPFFLFFVDFENEKNKVIENFYNKIEEESKKLSEYSLWKFDLEFYKNNSFAWLKNKFQKKVRSRVNK